MTFAGPALAANPAPEAAPAPTGQGDIVVTARKRSEDILKVPVTVTALTAEALEKRGVVSMQDMAASTPGININNNNSGHADRGFQQVIMRGFTSASAQAATTSLFIDGVSVSSPAAFTSISDPARIEILKGPQSAYFGRNTFAGAINVVNKLPSGEWGGEVLGSYGTRNSYRLRATVEGPILGDALTFRATVDRFRKGGSWQTTNSGITLGTQSSTNMNLLIVAKPTDGMVIKMFGQRSEDNDGPAATAHISAYAVTDPSGNTVVANRSNCTTAAGKAWFCGVTPSISGVSSNVSNTAALKDWLTQGSRRVASPSETVDGYGMRRISYHGHITADYQISDKLSASILAGYNHEVFSSVFDLDGYDSSALTANSTSTAYAKGYYDYVYMVERMLRDWSIEGRVNYSSDRFHGVAGVSYLDAYAVSGGGGGTSALTSSMFTVGGATEAKTFGAFFGATYDVTRSLSASFEGRYQIDSLYGYAAAAGQTIASSAYIPAGYYSPGQTVTHKAFGNFLPRAIVNWQINPRTMVYASWSKGVNPGAFNTYVLAQPDSVQQQAVKQGINLSIEPEKVTNYEIGMKGKALDGRLTYSAAAYYAQWTNQIVAVTLTIDAPGTAAGSVFVNGSANAGAVDMMGIEGNTSFRLNDLVTIDAAGAINDSRIINFVSPTITALSGITNYYGKQMPNSSKYSANIGIQFGGGVRGQGDARWFARGDWNFKSGMYADYSNSVRTPDLHIFNARAGFSKGRASLEVYMNNIFNNHTYTSVGDNYTLASGTQSVTAVYSSLVVGLPDLRSAGLQLKVKI
ncbi:MAG TPA: TonB-dependent receptor [Novosphingobium sp.]|nr:TonB-dependent receptor [Novosphingobium sp.]